LRPQLSAVRPTRRAIGVITACAATMQADIMAVASSVNSAASFCPTSGSSAAIGKMDQHHTQAEDDHRPEFEQDAIAGRIGHGLRRILLSVEVSRPVVIDRFGGNGKHCDACEHGENWHEKEHGAPQEGIANPGRHHGDGDIACVVKGRVPSMRLANWLRADPRTPPRPQDRRRR
jgi:hypothetical protein